MKRLVVCCDGTWQQPDQSRDGVGCPTNVVKLASLVVSEDTKGAKQRLFYHNGIGATSGGLRRWWQGLTGAGINQVLRETYSWIVRNYEPGDQLYLFGYSRGAYTARSVAGLIRNSGVLKPVNEDKLVEALALYRSRDRKTEPRAAASRLFRRSYCWADVTPIELVGVWDTVGALGVPNTVLQGALKALSRQNIEFHDTNLGPHIRMACHAVCIDERRKPFLPTLWTVPADGFAPGQRLAQLWFPGYHGDIGGGEPDSSLGDVSLGWMVEMAERAGLSVAPPDHLASLGLPQWQPRPDGPLHDTSSWFYGLLGDGTRTIPSPTGDQADLEGLHNSVEQRRAVWPDWQPRALEDYLARDGQG